MRKLAAVATLGMAILAIAGNGLAAEGVAFTADQAYPEGVAYSAKDKTFIVSSLRHGVIARVTASGGYQPYITDERLISTVGVLWDRKRNLLWVANSDPGLSTRSSDATRNKLAAVAVYDASTGAQRAYHELGGLVEGSHFANDLAQDEKGNVYVTDSFAPVIYRIDARGRRSVFARSDLFKGEGFNLNGIVVHPGGYLVVAKYNTGELFRVSLRHPEKVEPVVLKAPLKGADGLILDSAKRLFVVQNQGADALVELVSDDGWRSATEVSRRKTAMSFPTTGTRVAQSVYVLNARLDSLIDANAQKAKDFLLQQFDR